MRKHCHDVMFHLRNLCNDSPTTEKEAPQHPLPDFDIEDHHDYDLFEHQEQGNLTETGSSRSNRDTIIAELNKRVAELIVTTEEMKKNATDEICSLAVKTVHRCNLTLKSHSEQNSAEKTSSTDPLLVRIRKRKLGHQTRSFLSVRKKCKQTKNPFLNPTKQAGKKLFPITNYNNFLFKIKCLFRSHAIK